MTIAPARQSVEGMVDDEVFCRLESEVRSYCRKFPAVLQRALGAEVFAEDGRSFIDFFCGAGTLNFGHNHPFIKSRLIEYMAGDGLMHGLDMYTVAKREFLQSFSEAILQPRGLDYKVQFCGPTGTDAVEAALKLARKATGRRGMIAFTGAFHGMSRGSLAVTGSRRARRAGSVGQQDVTFVPFEDGPLGTFDSMTLIERLLADPSSGTELPAAVIVEPVQMEGGVYPASASWLRELRALTEKYGVLLIADEIQVGCGRTGDFFAFEQAGIVPDIVTVSKSISGYGLPLSLSLFRRDLDVWEAGEHTGTFRGNQLAFVAATAMCELWQRQTFQAELASTVETLDRFRAELASEDGLRTRGRGAAVGIDLSDAGGPERAARVQRHAFENGLIVELSGREDEVVKLLTPLNIEPGLLNTGLSVLRDGLRLSATGPA